MTTPPSSGGSGSGRPAAPPVSSGGAAARPHESALGDMPTMESAPPSGNYYSSDAGTLNPLPPPPPPPKASSSRVTADAAAAAAAAAGRTLSPPPSGNATRSSGGGAVPPLPPPPKVSSSGSVAVTLPPPTSQMMQRSPPASMKMIVPPPPPAAAAAAANSSRNDPPALADGLVGPEDTTRTSNRSSSGSSSSSSADYSYDYSNNNSRPPPPRLPLTTFLPPLKGGTSTSTTTTRMPLGLARRQTHVPILVIATEAAQQVAWKNGLQLTDLFQGIVEQDLLFGTTGNTSLPPFRSVQNKHMTLTELPVQFVDAQQQQGGQASFLTPMSYSGAHSLLQEHAKLQDSDGNVPQELVLLEDRVELLLQDDDGAHDPTKTTTTTKSSSFSSLEFNANNNNNHKKDDLRQVTKDAFQLTSPLDIPWLIRYRAALDASTNAMPHDLIQCPPLVLLVCSTTTGANNEVESPLEVLQELYNSPHILPDVFKNGLYDPSPASMRREVLVLHDNTTTTATTASSTSNNKNKNFDEASLRSTLQSQFGPLSHVLCINNVPEDIAHRTSQEEHSDLWGGGGRLGTRLSVNDRALLRRYFQTLLTSALLPSLERRIANLNAIVSERKKGVRNLVKSFWRKPKDETTTATATSSSTTTARETASLSQYTSSSTNNSSDTANHPDNMPLVVQYRYDSIESQTRLLADTLFLIKDYEAALSTYKLIRDDFRSDKALVHYASVQEMMALCLYHLDNTNTYGGSRAKEIFSYLETALLSYTRAAEDERKLMMAGRDSSARPSTAPHATRLATRLCLLLAATADYDYDSSNSHNPALTKGRELEVADLLASASSHESSLGAAVLLEQASAFYYEASMYRKYAFHMLMSGHMFRTANQDHHAFRCFTSALYIYRHGNWPELHNHLKSALAAQLYSMGRMAVAMVLYAKLVGGAGKVSVKSQQKFLSHLLEICTEHAKAALAGADRMAVPPNNSVVHTTARQRDAARQDHLERIVQVIQYTPGASRVLELPYMNLPRIVDPSVRIWTHAEDHFVGTSTMTTTAKTDHSVETVLADDLSSELISRSLGKSCRGDSDVWNDLELLATAEWNALDSTARGLDENVTAALSKIRDPQHRRVIAQIDKEKQSKALIERSRRKGNIKPKPATRARREPIFCDFLLQNPMDIDISVTQIQLVARMVDSNDTICTNQDAIRLSTNDEANDNKIWTFPSTRNQTFTVAEFCRISEKNQTACASASANPFFVVTKQNLDLSGGSEMVVSAGLTPLVEGDLEILGVRCKLSNQVWVYHPFDIPGPLLNDTRSDRANRVRGESLVLKSKISVDMPCVTAELVKRPSATSTSSVVTSDDGPLLGGQITSWILRLRNVGSAPACQPILKTNLPWINIPYPTSDKGVSDEELESRATSNCVGPTGTLMRLPLEGAHLKEAGAIYPGETVDIPIQIRTSETGKQQFYMLYRYALYDTDVQEPSRTRWLRKMYEVPVFPSLALDARVVASFRKDNEQMLSVELTNNRTDRPIDLYITLDKLSLASRRYRLEILPGQFSTSDQVSHAVQIGWQERLTVHYRVVASEGDTIICKLSQCPFQEDAVASSQNCVKSDSMDFLCLERASETFEAAWTSHQNELFRAEHDQDGGGNHPRSIASIRRANTSDSGNMPDSHESSFEIYPTSIGKLCPPESSASSAHLICNWRAILGDDVIHGEHHMRAISIRPKTSFKGRPINVSASHPSTLSHDFSKGPAVVPVRVTLRNRMLESPVNFSVSVDNKKNGFELIGLDVLLLSLEPSDDIVIPFEVLIPQPGIHNLQALQLIVRHNDEDLPYPLEQQWLLHVSDSSPTKQ